MVIKTDSGLSFPSPFAGEQELSGYDKVFIHGLDLMMSIGIHEKEKQSLQRVLVDVEAFVRPALSGGEEEDTIENTVCYETLTNRIEELASSTHFNLVETFADRIAYCAFRSDDRICAVRLRVTKPDILENASVGVEILRYRT